MKKYFCIGTMLIVIKKSDAKIFFVLILNLEGSVEKININEIAKLAGVSRATVSRYLNNGYVSEEKRNIIAKVIEDTGYIPSAQARILRTKKSKLIGVIIPKLDSQSISREILGINEALSKEGYQIILAGTFNNEHKELEYLKVLQNNQVDGIILIATVFTKQHKKLLQELSIPVVIVGQYLKGYSCIYNDDYNAAKDITKELIKDNRKNPGYIGVNLDDESAGSGRYNGYIDAIKEYGIDINKNNMKIAKFNMEDGYLKTKELFLENPNIDALFCATDNIAVGAMQYLKECGKKIPEDISIVGFGHTNISKVVEPKLTTVHFHYKTSGIEAANIIMNMIENGDKIIRDIKMGYEIIVQESTN